MFPLPVLQPDLKIEEEEEKNVIVVANNPPLVPPRLKRIAMKSKYKHIRVPSPH